MDNQSIDKISKYVGKKFGTDIPNCMVLCHDILLDFGIDVPIDKYDGIYDTWLDSDPTYMERAMCDIGVEVIGELRSLDIVMISLESTYATHIGIYIGDGKFIHVCEQTRVRVSNLNNRFWSERYRGARRVVL